MSKYHQEQIWKVVDAAEQVMRQKDWERNREVYEDPVHNYSEEAKARFYEKYHAAMADIRRRLDTPEWSDRDLVKAAIDYMEDRRLMAEISDGSFYRSGRNKKFDRKIAVLKRRLKELEG